MPTPRPERNFRARLLRIPQPGHRCRDASRMARARSRRRRRPDRRARGRERRLIGFIGMGGLIRHGHDRGKHARQSLRHSRRGSRRRALPTHEWVDIIAAAAARPSSMGSPISAVMGTSDRRRRPSHLPETSNFYAFCALGAPLYYLRSTFGAQHNTWPPSLSRSSPWPSGALYACAGA